MNRWTLGRKNILALDQLNKVTLMPHVSTIWRAADLFPIHRGELTGYAAFRPSSPNPDKRDFGAMLSLDVLTYPPGFASVGSYLQHDMEVLYYVQRGRLSFEAISNQPRVTQKGELTQGDMVLFSTGKGLVYHLKNAQPDQNLDMICLWLLPQRLNLPPQTQTFRLQEREFCHEWVPYVVPAGQASTLSINQDALVHVGAFGADRSVTYETTRPHHGTYLYVMEGEIIWHDQLLSARDALSIFEPERLQFYTQQATKLMLVEVPLR